jgi:hypothetical protein
MTISKKAYTFTLEITKKIIMTKFLGRVSVNTISAKNISKALKPPAMKRRRFFSKLAVFLVAAES